MKFVYALGIEHDLHPYPYSDFYRNFARISWACIIAAVIGGIVLFAVSLWLAYKGKITIKQFVLRAIIAVVIAIGTFSLALIAESILETIVPRHVC